MDECHPNASQQVAARLCAACGMCCNGVLFHSVSLQEEDAPRALAALGLKIKRKAGTHSMLQPCTAHKDFCCTIYTRRPARCRIFACRQLLEVAAGSRSEQAAMQAIRAAQVLVGNVETLFAAAGEHRKHKPFATRFEALCTPPFDDSPQATALRAQLTQTWNELQATLQKDFRVLGD